MKRDVYTSAIYLVAAALACSSWVIGQQVENPMTGAGNVAALSCSLVFFGIPILFVFVYPRSLFGAAPSQDSHQRLAMILHGVGLAVTTLLFGAYASGFWENRFHGENLALRVAPFIALPVFLVTAVSLLARKKSTLTTAASFLLWPYWLLLAALNVREPQETWLRATFYFLYCIVPILFAFAAGAVAYRQSLAHPAALAGLVGMPWIYWTALHDTPLGNIWTSLNAAGTFFYNPFNYLQLTILSAALTVLAIGTATLRLFPPAWTVRGQAISDRTWPAFGVSFVFLAIWFSQSVMPYRISGAMDYNGYPVLEILHVEKRGLQFHENSVRVWGGYRNYPVHAAIYWNNRRLFQYRFRENYVRIALTQPTTERIQSVIQSLQATKRTWDPAKPIRTWNADRWYVLGDGIALRAYAADKENPPRDVVDLFNELSKNPHNGENRSDIKDICLGFCYDPLSELGFLYANHRCGYDQTRKDYVCR